MKRVLLLLGILLCFSCVISCGKEEEKADEWTYERFEDELGGIIEMDVLSIIQCFHEFYVQEIAIQGYVIQGGVTCELSDEPETGSGSNTIGLPMDNEKLYGELVYIRGKDLNKIYEGRYRLMDIKKCSLDEEEGIEYRSVREYIRLMENFYENTYIKVEGLVMQDGTKLDGTPNYKLYPSEESYNENISKFIFLYFTETPANLHGKHITVMGKPDDVYSLVECNVVEEK